jgi:predicted nucleic-acid-binding Zn-ribbon protein
MNATTATANLKARLTKIQPTTATTKCCIWCGYGDHYTDEPFTKNGVSVAHCSKGCEHDATGVTSTDTHEPDGNYRHVRGECELLGCINARYAE